jgi:hypothetical protein
VEDIHVLIGSIVTLYTLHVGWHSLQFVPLQDSTAKGQPICFSPTVQTQQQTAGSPDGQAKAYTITYTLLILHPGSPLKGIHGRHVGCLQWLVVAMKRLDAILIYHLGFQELGQLPVQGCAAMLIEEDMVQSELNMFAVIHVFTIAQQYK